MIRSVTALLIAFSAVAISGAETLKLPRLGDVPLIFASGPPAGVVILFSDPGAATPLPSESLQALAEGGRVVTVVDPGRYLADLDRTAED